MLRKIEEDINNRKQQQKNPEKEKQNYKVKNNSVDKQCNINRRMFI